jgi:hypothetical protein
MKLKGLSIIGLFVLLLNTTLHATVSSYSFTNGGGNYVAITGTTLYSGTWDDGASSLITLPFTFTYNNSPFTTVSVTPNGFLTLGSVPSGTIYCGLQSSSTPANSIAGYGTDLVGVSTGSSIQYTTSGTAPNRKFVVQWTDCDHYGTGGVNHLNFQIVLNETTNIIQVVYGTFTMSSTFGANTCSDASTESGNVGLLGGNASDFNIRKVLNGTNTWSTSTAGTVISDVCNLSPTNIPSPGLTYTWTPSAPVAMTYVSSTTALINNGVGIPHPSTNNQVLQIQVVTTGSLSPLSISTLNLSTSGTTSPLVDLTNAKVFYTGISSTFSSSTQFGSTIINPNGTISFTGSATLQEGTNYFWLVYDIAAGAIVNDHITGCCNSIVGSGTIGTRTPTITCPSGFQIISQLGIWTLLSNNPPHANGGGMILLSDGTVLCKTFSGGSDGYGNIYDRLTPDANGSYANGTWSSIAPMINTRLYYSSQVLMDGRLYVAGGEYGTGLAAGEVYNPLTNTWTLTPSPGGNVSDANSEMLPDGRVLQALVAGSLTSTKIYDPTNNTYINGPTALGIHNESAWVKLADNSILYVNRLSTSSERYIPATNSWINDATVPVSLYDAFGLETGGALLLPDGRAFFLGSTGHTAYYTPTGTTSPGVWTAGPDIPNLQGTPDAPAAMMVNGKILLTVSPLPTSANHFPSPTSFYEFDYVTNSFTQLGAPGGGTTTNVACYLTNMLDLPDGNVLYSRQSSSQYYIYTPSGQPVVSGKPTISTITPITCSEYSITGTKFNGISQGATYGDDWQMNSNYPLVRLKSGSNVYYARTYNWNSTGVMRGTAADTAKFTLPAGLPTGTYSLEVVANGIASNPTSFSTSISPTISISSSAGTSICTGSSTTLTASISNGGTTPTFQWYKNSSIVGTSNSLTTSNIVNGDSIKCVMTSNYACLTSGSNPATSNTLNFISGYCAEDINVKVFIQGFYNPAGDTMNAVLDPINLPTVADSITLQLADSATHTIVAQDKKRISTHGNGTFHFTGLLPGHRYYIIFKGRNIIETWSKNSYLLTMPTLTIDMTH